MSESRTAEELRDLVLVELSRSGNGGVRAIRHVEIVPHKDGLTSYNWRAKVPADTTDIVMNEASDVVDRLRSRYQLIGPGDGRS